MFISLISTAQLPVNAVLHALGSYVGMAEKVNHHLQFLAASHYWIRPFSA